MGWFRLAVSDEERAGATEGGIGRGFPRSRGKAIAKQKGLNPLPNSGLDNNP